MTVRIQASTRAMIEAAAKLNCRSISEEMEFRLTRSVRRDEEAAANARLAHLTGICPQCGDAGWWIDDSGFHYCACAAGARSQEEDEGGGD